MQATNSKRRDSKAGKKGRASKPKTSAKTSAKQARPQTYPESGLADYDEAAVFLRISRRTLERRVAAGDLSPVKQSPRCVRLRWEDVRKYNGKAN